MDPKCGTNQRAPAYLAHLFLLFEEQRRLARLRNAGDHLLELIRVDGIFGLAASSVALLGHKDPLFLGGHRKCYLNPAVFVACGLEQPLTPPLLVAPLARRSAIWG